MRAHIQKPETLRMRGVKNPYLFLIALLFIIVPCPPTNGQTDSPRLTPVVRAVQKVSPGVVNISTEEIIQSNPFSRMDPFADSFFRDFFDTVPAQRSRTSLGSGFIIDPEGHVVTNEHVIARATNIAVTLADNRTFTAKVIGADEDFDIAVLKLQTDEKLPFLPAGTSSDLMPGETVVAIGNPFGLSHTVTTGVISAVNRSLKTESRIYENFIQTDAAINPGNSGGPLVNLNGEIVGINTAIYQEGQGIGFAIPIDKVSLIAKDLLAYGAVHPAYSGIRVKDLTGEIKQSLDYGGKTGVAVFKVDAQSPAAGSLIPGDIILELNGRTMNDRREFATYSQGLIAGEKMVSLMTTEYPLQRASELGRDLLGIEAKEYNQGGMRVTRIDPDGPAAYIGMRPGDIIFQVGDREIKSEKQFYESLIRYRDASSLFMVIGRGRYAYRVSVPLL
jgi:S1-C subfamily serine protease